MEWFNRKGHGYSLKVQWVELPTSYKGAQLLNLGSEIVSNGQKWVRGFYWGWEV